MKKLTLNGSKFLLAALFLAMQLPALAQDSTSSSSAQTATTTTTTTTTDHFYTQPWAWIVGSIIVVVIIIAAISSRSRNTRNTREVTRSTTIVHDDRV